MIDNVSRKILAFTVADHLEPAATCEVLIASSRHLVGPGSSTTVVADSGIENVNDTVDATLASTSLRRVLAQVDVTHSNSMIEAWWRSLKHQWLFLNSLDTIDHRRTLVAFFVDAHNTQMPHAAFAGHTPDEMYLGAAPNLVAELAAARAVDREQRLATNRSASCAESPNPIGPRLGSPLTAGPSQPATANVRLQDVLEHSWASCSGSRTRRLRWGSERCRCRSSSGLTCWRSRRGRG